MNEKFKINLNFDEKGEKLEDLIESLIINIIDKKEEQCLNK